MNDFSNDFPNDFPDHTGFWGFIEEMPLLFKLFGGLIFAIVIGGFLYVIIRGLWMWTSNNAADLVTKAVTVVDKRTEVWGGSGDSSTSTNYYVTFEMHDRSRLELQVRDNKFGLIVIGDQGELTYQGTRFKEFRRSGMPMNEGN